MKGFHKKSFFSRMTASLMANLHMTLYSLLCQRFILHWQPMNGRMVFRAAAKRNGDGTVPLALLLRSVENDNCIANRGCRGAHCHMVE